MKKIGILFTLWAVVLACQTKVKNENQTLSSDVNAVSLELKVDGMTCEGCERTIEKGLKMEKGVFSVIADHESGSAIITVDTSIMHRSQIITAIEELGYSAQ